MKRFRTELKRLVVLMMCFIMVIQPLATSGVAQMVSDSTIGTEIVLDDEVVTEDEGLPDESPQQIGDEEGTPGETEEVSKPEDVGLSKVEEGGKSGKTENDEPSEAYLNSLGKKPFELNYEEDSEYIAELKEMANQEHDDSYYLDRKEPIPWRAEATKYIFSTYETKADLGTIDYEGSFTVGSGEQVSQFAKFEVDGNIGFCAEQPKEVPPTGSKIQSITEITNDTAKHKNMRKALYYGYKGPASKVSTNNQGFAETSVALSRSNGYTAGWPSTWGLYNMLDSLDNAPSTFKVYICNMGGNYQDIAYWEYEPDGKLQFEKSTATVANLHMKTTLSVEGARYSVYTTKKAAEDNDTDKREKILKIKSSGLSQKVSLPIGTYYVKETKAAPGHRLDSTIYTVKIESGKLTKKSVKDTPQYGNAYIEKTSSNSHTADNSNYSLKGAEFGVYPTEDDANKGTNKELTLKTDANGVTQTVKLQKGTWYIKEIKAPKGFKLSTDVKSWVIKDDETNKKSVSNSPIRPDLKIHKTSNQADIKCEGIYSLEGTEYKLYRSYTKGTSAGKVNGYDTYIGGTLSDLVKTFTIGSNGYSEEFTLVADTYYLVETKATQGYLKDDRVYEVNLTLDNLKPVVEHVNEVLLDPLAIVVQKLDADTGQPVPVGKGELAGAEFLVKFFPSVFETTDPEAKGITYSKIWRFKTDENGRIRFTDDPKYFVEGSSFYRDSGNNIGLPDGTLTVVEDKAPKGYLKDTKVHVTQVKYGQSNGTAEFKAIAVNEPSIKGDIELTKVDTQTREKLAGIQFNIISKTTNKVVKTITTDKNGYASTKDGSGKGTLPFDDYIVREVNPPAKYYPLADQHVSITESDNNKTINVGTLENPHAEVVTSAVSKDSGIRTELPVESVTVTDTVSYKYLRENNAYTLKGYLVDKATGNAITINGKKVEASKTFTPTAKNGSTTLSYTFDARGLAGKTLVVYEELYLGNTLVADHKDINDANQTITFTSPSMTTQARFKSTGYQVNIANGNVTVTDTIAYKDLLPNKEYKVTGGLMNTDGSQFAVNGTNIVAEKKFTPTSADGTVTLEYTFSANNLKGTKVVGYARLYAYLGYNNGNGYLVTSHVNTTSAEQTVYIPKITTKATDIKTGTDIAKVEDTVEIVDVISYEKLKPGLEYTVSGVLMDKVTGNKLLVDGKEVAVTKSFTPTSENGTYIMNFKFKGSDMYRKTLVVYETIALKGVDVASHKDIDDLNQTIYYPEIKTLALDSLSDTHVGNAASVVGIKDTVSYYNLVVGREYELTGTLIDKATGEPILVDGNVVTASKKFTAESVNGSVLVKFTFGGSGLAGKTVVVYETLKYAGKDIAEHRDINDVNQTIQYPELDTVAIDMETEDHITNADNSIIIKDTVKYKNLPLGDDYSIEGTLVDRETGEPIKVVGNVVKVVKSFSATDSTGQVDMQFKFDGSELAGTSIVVFEVVKKDGIEVASHRSLVDQDQTVKVPKIGTTALDVDTMDHISSVTKKVNIVDNVVYHNLLVGKEYTVYGKLMNKATGEPLLVDGKEVTAEKTFVAEASDGSVLINFKFNGRGLKNTTVVAFERLEYKGIEVAAHTDISDAKQTVHFPEIGTVAIDSDSKDHISLADNKVTIIDTVNYKNVLAGKTYKLTGKLMDKSTGEPLVVDGGEVVVTKEFTPDSANGSVDVVFEFDGTGLDGKTLVAFEYLEYKDVELAVHLDIDDEGQTIHIPEVGTLALDADTENHIASPDSEVTIVDTVSYKNLLVGKEYVAKGILMNKATGEVIKVDGKEVTSETKFTAEKADGEVEVVFTFDGTGLGGTTVVSYETLEYNKVPVGIHADINDDAQSILFPEIKTSALDSETKNNISLADDEVTIVDTVSYKNVLVGEEYTLSGKLMDKETGKAILVDGKEVVGSTTFTAESANGAADVVFKFKGTDLAGKTLVVFETLSYKDVEIAVHKDINDVKQTVHLPKVETTALDNATKDHIAKGDEKVTIIDTVDYTNLVPNREYIISGVLMVKDTNEPLVVDGKQVTSEVKFTPEKADGSIDLVFEFDGSALRGKTLVAFETVSYEGIPVGIHADINDEDQTVYIPNIATTALDFETEDHISLAEKEMVIVDTVKYENLIPGKEYKVAGSLIDKDLNKMLEVDGNNVTSETRFTPEKADGTVEVKFVLDGSALAGKTLVVYEVLYLADEEIADHLDINDADQTIHIPEIATSALDTESNTQMSMADEKVTVVDTVDYKNLIPGKEYTVTGKLMNKGTGEALIVNGREVTETVTFTPESADGAIDVVFEFNGSALKGETFVVFEDVYLGKNLVATHHDIDDVEQTIYFPEIGTTALDADTEDHITNADGEVVIIDTVKYSNVIKGYEYTVKGVLKDKATGESLKGAVAESKFVAEDTEGAVEVVFKFDGSALAGETFVAFEKLYVGEAEIANHEDIEDVAQTVHVPKIGTSAIDNDSKVNVSMADEEVTVVDTVTYTNLLPGKEYKVSGTLMNKATGEALKIDEKEVTAETVFTPEKADGTVDVVFTFNGSALAGETLVVFETLYFKDIEVASHTVIEDEAQTIHIPKIGTAAIDKEVGINLSLADEKVTVVDTVKYSNLVPGLEYEVKGILMDKATGEALLINGQPVKSNIKITPDEPNGVVDLEFVFNASGLDGASLVVFEDLFVNNSKVATHSDIDDEAQTVHIPKVGTTAIAVDTEDHITLADEEVVVVDTVKYENLIPGKEYTVKGILMDRTSGQPVTVDGVNITSEKVFTPDKADGSIELEFKFNGSALAGTSVVAFETVEYNGKEVAIHADIEDAEQTVKLPKIATTALDKDTVDHISSADEEVTIIDTVSYKNLLPGKTYVVTGKLMDRETGNPILVDGSEVTAEKEFTAEATDGVVEVEFTFNGSALKGITTVAFETISYKGVKVAVHEDINDVEQSVELPKITTTALDSESKDHISLADEEITVVDTVHYKNLLAGKEYTVKGKLMDKATGEVLVADGKEVVVEQVFTPENSAGSVDITFVFNGIALAGKTVVAFESLEYKGIEVAIHADITDEEQTVYIPKIGTTALDKNTQTHVSGADEEVTIVDTVAYENLIPGKEYTVKGTLMDKATGEAVVVGDALVVSELKFTPEAPSGTVDIEFTFDGSALDGATVVAFECIYLGDVEVACHNDIEDIEQTVYMPKLSTTAVEKEIGTHEAFAYEGTVIVDTVEYSNLVPGMEYKLVGIPMVKSSGEAVGDDIQVELLFTPEEANGFVDLEVPINTTDLAGESVVMFEYLYLGEELVGSHDDIDDVDQTVDVANPESSTTLKGKWGKKSLKVNKNTVLTDTVTYTDLIPGREYTVKGILMDKETGKELKVDGKTVTSEVTFEAKKADGTVKVKFKFDSTDLAKKSVVAFEEIYTTLDSGEEYLVTAHKDIDDKAQTVSFKEVKIDTGVGLYTPYMMVGVIVLVGLALVLVFFNKRNQE